MIEEVRHPRHDYPRALFGALLTAGAVYVLVGLASSIALPADELLPHRKTPWVAIVATTAVAVLLTLVGDLATLAQTVVLLLLIVLLSTNIAVLVLRRDRVEHDHFRVWTVVPVLGALSCVLLLTQQEPMVWLFAAILIAVGVGLFFLARLGRRADPVE